MTEGTRNIVNTREDYSDYLFHFTKGKDALDNLKTILSMQALVSFEDDNVISFTEAPLPILCNMFDYFLDAHPNRPMFAPYGIGFKKQHLYDLGARHAIYGDGDEFNKLHPDLKWRFVKFDINSEEFSWQREWRLKTEKGLLDLDYSSAIVVVRSKEDLEHLKISDTEMILDGDIDDGAFHASMTVIEHGYRCVTMEQVRGLCNQDVNQLIENQATEIIIT